MHIVGVPAPACGCQSRDDRGPDEYVLSEPGETRRLVPVSPTAGPACPQPQTAISWRYGRSEREEQAARPAASDADTSFGCSHRLALTRSVDLRVLPTSESSRVDRTAAPRCRMASRALHASRRWNSACVRVRSLGIYRPVTPSLTADYTRPVPSGLFRSRQTPRSPEARAPYALSCGHFTTARNK